MTNYSTQPYNPYQPTYTAPASMPQTQSIYNPYQPTYTAPAPSADGWGFALVQGEAGAHSFIIPPNGKYILMAPDIECFYIKTSDASGIPQPLRSFKFTEITGTPTPTQPQSQAQPQVQPQPQTQARPQKQYNSDFITRGELNKILNERLPKDSRNSNNSSNTNKENK